MPPVLREAVPSHDSLIQHLRPIADRLRDGLGDDERILLGFDRAGAYAEELAALRDAEFEFVTYERKPYPLLATTAFSDAVILGEKVGIHENRLRNLGKGRGRVRRIAVLTDEGQQVNLLAVSREPAERLVEILSHRWRQENAFKHGVERWGINQLDGRRVTSYPPGTIIPNPLRRRLDRALRIARVEEGMARRILARHPSDAARDRAQRFGSLLQLDPHGHAVVPDGVFAGDRKGGVELVPLPAPTDDELQAVALAIVKGVLRLLARAAEPAFDQDDVTMMQVLAEATQMTRVAARRDRDDRDGARRQARRAALIHTDLGLFSIHADTDVAAHDRAGLERLVRDGARPAFAHKRLSITPSGKVCYRLRKPYYTGQTEVVLEPAAFLRRLAALVPPRGQHQVRY